eukprot:9870904-Alexandrium_andersonii.AAC.1
MEQGAFRRLIVDNLAEQVVDFLRIRKQRANILNGCISLQVVATLMGTLLDTDDEASSAMTKGLKTAIKDFLQNNGFDSASMVPIDMLAAIAQHV